MYSDNRRAKLINDVKLKIKKVSPRIRVLEKASEIADLVLSKEEKYASISTKELRNLSYRMMDQIQQGAQLDNFLIDGLAIAREIIYRVHKMKAYKVQLIGAIVAHFGDFAEMKTGEGKTLTLLLVSYVNALSKKGVHIVTVNEYLVERDMKFSQEALGELGITVGCVLSTMQPDEKRKMYACDITYVSNSELGFDYLRDNMVEKYEDKMQRGLNFAIVDEADSVLIDESRTPLIIAANPDEGVELYIEVDDFVKSLKPDDYVIDLESHAINLNDNGIRKTEEHFKIKNLYDIENSEIVHKIMNSLRANYIMEIGKEYIIQKNKETGANEIALVDTFTGRVMEGRMYSAGLHQAIQAKERVEIEPENKTVATITYQSFFRLYNKLAGFSGTALTEKNEFLNIYNMVVVDIPTNKPVKRIDQPDYIFSSKQAKWKYVAAEIKRRHEKGQPVLVGTVSVEDSELLHRLLDHLKIPHQVLNAKNNQLEAEIVKKAGQKGAVTIATNMAGRGTDIKLGEGVKELGGLYVLGTERNESRRIDNQLRGRSGRQGDPGESRFFISLQDSLFRRFASDKFDKAQYKLGEEMIDLKFFSRLLDRTQKRVEGSNFDIRKNLIDYDYVLSEQRELVYKQRNNILLSKNMLAIIQKMVPRVIDVFVSTNRDEQNVNMIDYDNLIKEIYVSLNYQLKLKPEQLKDLTDVKVYELIVNEISNELVRIYNENDKEANNEQWKSITISTLDRYWTIFLDKIQKLRDGVSLRSYEQKTPLNIYVEDSDRLFYNITIDIAKEVISSIMNSQNGFVQKTELKLQDKSNLIMDSSQLDIKNLIPRKNTIEDLELSNVSNSDNKSDNELIRFDQQNQMSKKEGKGMNDNKIGNNVQDVVDEILNGEKNIETVEPQQIKTTPPPIPQPQHNTMPPPPPPIPQEIKSKPQNDDNDFLKQVMDVVNNDIDVKPIDLEGIDEIINEVKNEEQKSQSQSVPPIPTIPIDNKVETYNVEPSNEFVRPEFIIDEQNQPTNRQDFILEPKPVFENTTPSYNNYKSPRDDGKFARSDNLKPESYNHNLRIERPNYFEIERIQRELDDKHINLINEKYQNIIDVKDQNIEALMNHSDDLIKEIENEKLEYSKQIEEIYKKENDELRDIKDKLVLLLDEKEKLEKVVYDYQLKELEEAHRKMKEERERLERERLLEEARKREEYEREQARLKEIERAENERKMQLEQRSLNQRRPMHPSQRSINLGQRPNTSYRSGQVNRGPSAINHRPNPNQVVSLRDAIKK